MSNGKLTFHTGISAKTGWKHQIHSPMYKHPALRSMETNRIFVAILSLKPSGKGKLLLVWFGLSTGQFIRNYYEQTVAATQ